MIENLKPVIEKKNINDPLKKGRFLVFFEDNPVWRRIYSRKKDCEKMDTPLYCKFNGSWWLLKYSLEFVNSQEYLGQPIKMLNTCCF